MLCVPTGPPSCPEKFHYTERTKNSITLAWKPPRNDGGSPVIGYFVEKKRQDQQAFEPCNTEICPNMSMTVEGLDEAWMYEFRIKCANLIGESEPSIPLTVVIQDDEGESECWECVCFRSTGKGNFFFGVIHPKKAGIRSSTPVTRMPIKWC